jgi:hypothetical protein
MSIIHYKLLLTASNNLIHITVFAGFGVFASVLPVEESVLPDF